jgi:hypothetical protein
VCSFSKITSRRNHLLIFVEHSTVRFMIRNHRMTQQYVDWWRHFGIQIVFQLITESQNSWHNGGTDFKQCISWNNGMGLQEFILLFKWNTVYFCTCLDCIWREEEAPLTKWRGSGRKTPFRKLNSRDSPTHELSKFHSWRNMEHHGRKLLVEIKRNSTRRAALIFSFLHPVRSYKNQMQAMGCLCCIKL